MSSDSRNRKLLFVGLNEINFEFIERYVQSGLLPGFAHLIKKHGIQITASEQEYNHLEPWIQWVTVQTGKAFAEHGVFRLGDITSHEHKQIWEHLESHGLKVGAISPMNASNRTSNAAFFVPDPWTSTRVTGGFLLQKLSKVIHDLVNDNATGRVTIGSLIWIVFSLLRYVPIRKYARYARHLLGVLNRKSWVKAQILDELLFDVFTKEVRKNDPHFSTLFLNGGAHIQHHYMFNSREYTGQQRNPSWLISPEHDPVLEVYDQYDRLICELRKAFPEHRLMIATGLHQDPYPEEKYYWRLIAHEQFLKLIGIEFDSVQPLMSRDFIVYFSNAEQAEAAATILRNARAEDGISMFEVDNRGVSLFVMLTYPHDIPDGMSMIVGNRRIENLRQQVAFVAIKNGEHNGEGYLIDTGSENGDHPNIPLTKLVSIISNNFEIDWDFS